jgi:hypothetical protein
MTVNEWSRWYDFSELFEYYGPVRHNSEKSENRHIYKIFGKEGNLFTDDGFRLRSMTSFEGQKKLVGKTLDEEPCPLNKGDVGCYMFRVDLTCKGDEHKWDYIGLSAEKTDGIRKRLTSHFRKLCDLPNALRNEEDAWCIDKIEINPHRNKRPLSWEKNDIRGMRGQTANFKKASADIRELFSNDSGAIANPENKFFEKYVKIRLLVIAGNGKNIIETVNKAEGLALKAYESRFGVFPELNERDETKYLKGFVDKM